MQRNSSQIVFEMNSEWKRVLYSIDFALNCYENWSDCHLVISMSWSHLSWETTAFLGPISRREEEKHFLITQIFNLDCDFLFGYMCQFVIYSVHKTESIQTSTRNQRTFSVQFHNRRCAACISFAFRWSHSVFHFM